MSIKTKILKQGRPNLKFVRDLKIRDGLQFVRNVDTKNKEKCNFEIYLACRNVIQRKVPQILSY